MNVGKSIPINKNEPIGQQISLHLRFAMMAASQKQQLIEWTRTTVPPILPDAEQDICSELKANQTANAEVAPN